MSKILVHLMEPFFLMIAGLTEDEILDAVRSDGYVLGRSQLQSLLNGERDVVTNFKLLDADNPNQTESTPTPVIQTTLNDGYVSSTFRLNQNTKDVEYDEPEEPVVHPHWMQLMMQPKPFDLEDDGYIFDENELDDEEGEEQQLNTSSVLPVKPIKRGGKADLIFKMLCRKQGASIDEMARQLGWSEHGVSSRLHVDPKRCGFTIYSEKVDGERRYHLHFNDTKVVQGQIAYK